MNWKIRLTYFCIGGAMGVLWWKIIGHLAAGFVAFGLTMLVLSLCWVAGENKED